jgi:antitoxin (DNA-binding transcriptional repressor) of toxin-antitoxin stability system
VKLCETMNDMRVSLRELHRRTGAVVDSVVRGGVVVIEKRGKPVAEMRAALPSAPGFPAEHWESLKRFPRFSDDGGRFISESRDRG